MIINYYLYFALRMHCTFKTSRGGNPTLLKSPRVHGMVTAALCLGGTSCHSDNMLRALPPPFAPQAHQQRGQAPTTGFSAPFPAFPSCFLLRPAASAWLHKPLWGQVDGRDPLCCAGSECSRGHQNSGCAGVCRENFTNTPGAYP